MSNAAITPDKQETQSTQGKSESIHFPPNQNPSYDYEYTDESGIYEVSVEYIGKTPLIDLVRAAIKRDFDLLYDELKSAKTQHKPVSNQVIQ